MFKLSTGPYLIQTERAKLPALYSEYTKRAILSEEFDLLNAEREHCFISVSRSADWPQLVVAQTFWPSAGGFDPGVLLVPETETLFVGAGEACLLTGSIDLSGYGKTAATWDSGNGSSTDDTCSCRQNWNWQHGT